MSPKARSKAQAGLFGAIAAGRARRRTGITRAEARRRLRGVKVRKLPRRRSS